MKFPHEFMLAACLALLASGAIGQNPASTTTATGQGLDVTITPPAVDPAQTCNPVLVSTVANLGSPPPIPVNFIYVTDVSGSMENPAASPFQDLTGDGFIDSADDCNGDGIQGSALDALCFGLIALNGSLGNPGSVDIGLVAFGNGSKVADMSPIGGLQDFLSPPQTDVNANLVTDVEEVVRSLDTHNAATVGLNSAGIGLFTFDITSAFSSFTNYNAAITSMNTLFASQPAGELNKAFFFSDGEPNPSSSFSSGAGSPLAAAVTAGTVINTFALGGFAVGQCNAGQPLRTIADVTGGVCTEVVDPSTLAAILPGVVATQITSLNISVNGVEVASTSGSEPATMSLSGINIAASLLIGANDVSSTVTTADGTILTARIVVNGVDCPPPPPTGVCPHTQGFWKNHPAQWPVMELTLGGLVYTQAECLTLFGTPVRGDASLNLAHQLMAAKLGIASGSDPAPIQTTIDDADAILAGGGTLPQGIQSSSATGQSMTALASVLDDYNNGLLTPTCTPLGSTGPATPTRRESKRRGPK